VDRFSDRRVIVTGAGSGIGQATVLRLLREDGTVHAVDVDGKGLGKTGDDAAAAGVDGKLTTALLDVSDEAAVVEGVASAVSALGGLDVLVNAAGILRGAHTHEHTLQVWNQVIGVNLTGTFLMTRESLPALLASGKGVVVNFSSTSAHFGHPYMAAYAASKGGIESFTHTLALEYAKQGLRAVAVAPGGIMTGMSEATPGLLPADADWDLFAKMMPALGQGNMAGPDAVGNMIAALASDDGFYVTGSTLRIDGGAHG
jgi:NAD(P)-dependent dehydrogenase (short-subunit alcohol dehydrogenase family)